MNNEIQVLAPNLKRRLSGVTATIVRLVPLQSLDINIRATGPGLPAETPRISLPEVFALTAKTRRVWHARRNTEMLLGLVLKYVFRKNLKLLFTSASQRKHSGYTKWLISKMDAVVVTSAKGKSYLEVPATVIHHGIDLEQFTPVDNKTELRRELGLPQGVLIGCFGRIRHQKGTDLFVDTLIKLAEEHPSITGVILGRATEKHLAFEKQLKEQVAAAGLSERIKFYGEVTVDQIAQWYQALDLFIAPQRWEGFGLTPLEAMACGVPVITADVGAFAELIVENETGAIIARDSLDEMVRTTGSVLQNPQRLALWSANARQHMEENFALQKEAEALNEIYGLLLKAD